MKPRKSPEQKRICQVATMLTRIEKRALDGLAREMGMSTAGIIRLAIRRFAKDELAELEAPNLHAGGTIANMTADEVAKWRGEGWKALEGQESSDVNNARRPRA